MRGSYGTCRNCGKRRAMITLKIIGPTRLCDVCVGLIISWARSENRHNNSDELILSDYGECDETE